MAGCLATGLRTAGFAYSNAEIGKTVQAKPGEASQIRNRSDSSVYSLRNLRRE